MPVHPANVRIERTKSVGATVVLERCLAFLEDKGEGRCVADAAQMTLICVCVYMY